MGALSVGESIVYVLVAVFIAPLIGGVVSGLDRRLTARLQSRMGPPIMQPFYDLAKLFGKERRLSNVWIAFCAWTYLIAAVVAVAMFMLQTDLILLFFVQAVGAVFLVIGALSVRSPYSQIGGERELLQLVTYEPLLLLVFVGIGLHAGDFSISAVYTLDQPMLFQLPLLFIVLSYVFTIKLRKSPFDIAGSHHAHQEIVRGVYTEYSGPYLGLVELAHFYEIFLLLGLASLFWSTSAAGIILVPVLLYIAEIIVDNATARMTWRWLLGPVLGFGVALSCINLIWIYAG